MPFRRIQTSFSICAASCSVSPLSVKPFRVRRLHPHLFRHTFSHNYLQANPGDLVGLAQILGHVSISTTSIYAQKSQDDLNEATDKLVFPGVARGQRR